MDDEPASTMKRLKHQHHTYVRVNHMLRCTVLGCQSTIPLETDGSAPLVPRADDRYTHIHLHFGHAARHAHATPTPESHIPDNKDEDDLYPLKIHSRSALEAQCTSPDSSVHHPTDHAQTMTDDDDTTATHSHTMMVHTRHTLGNSTFAASPAFASAAFSFSTHHSDRQVPTTTQAAALHASPSLSIAAYGRASSEPALELAAPSPTSHRTKRRNGWLTSSSLSQCRPLVVDESSAASLWTAAAAADASNRTEAWTPPPPPHTTRSTSSTPHAHRQKWRKDVSFHRRDRSTPCSSVSPAFSSGSASSVKLAEDVAQLSTHPSPPPRPPLDSDPTIARCPNILPGNGGICGETLPPTLGILLGFMTGEAKVSCMSCSMIWVKTPMVDQSTGSDFSSDVGASRVNALSLGRTLVRSCTGDIATPHKMSLVHPEIRREYERVDRLRMQLKQTHLPLSVPGTPLGLSAHMAQLNMSDDDDEDGANDHTRHHLSSSSVGYDYFHFSKYNVAQSVSTPHVEPTLETAEHGSTISSQLLSWFAPTTQVHIDTTTAVSARGPHASESSTVENGTPTLSLPHLLFPIPRHGGSTMVGESMHIRSSGSTMLSSLTLPPSAPTAEAAVPHGGESGSRLVGTKKLLRRGKDRLTASKSAHTMSITSGASSKQLPQRLRDAINLCLVQLHFLVPKLFASNEMRLAYDTKVRQTIMSNIGLLTQSGLQRINQDKHIPGIAILSMLSNGIPVFYGLLPVAVRETYTRALNNVLRRMNAVVRAKSFLPNLTLARNLLFMMVHHGIATIPPLEGGKAGTAPAFMSLHNDTQANNNNTSSTLWALCEKWLRVLHISGLFDRLSSAEVNQDIHSNPMKYALAIGAYSKTRKIQRKTVQHLSKYVSTATEGALLVLCMIQCKYLPFRTQSVMMPTTTPKASDGSVGQTVPKQTSTEEKNHSDREDENRADDSTDEDDYVDDSDRSGTDDDDDNDDNDAVEVEEYEPDNNDDLQPLEEEESDGESSRLGHTAPSTSPLPPPPQLFPSPLPMQTHEKMHAFPASMEVQLELSSSPFVPHNRTHIPHRPASASASAAASAAASELPDDDDASYEEYMQKMREERESRLQNLMMADDDGVGPATHSREANRLLHGGGNGAKTHEIMVPLFPLFAYCELLHVTPSAIKSRLDALYLEQIVCHDPNVVDGTKMSLEERMMRCDLTVPMVTPASTNALLGRKYMHAYLEHIGPALKSIRKQTVNAKHWATLGAKNKRQPDKLQAQQISFRQERRLIKKTQGIPIKDATANRQKKNGNDAASHAPTESSTATAPQVKNKNKNKNKRASAKRMAGPTEPIIESD